MPHYKEIQNSLRVEVDFDNTLLFKEELQTITYTYEKMIYPVISVEGEDDDYGTSKSGTDEDENPFEIITPVYKEVGTDLGNLTSEEITEGMTFEPGYGDDVEVTCELVGEVNTKVPEESATYYCEATNENGYTTEFEREVSFSDHCLEFM